MKKNVALIIIFLLGLFLIPSTSFAKMGVGVGTGKITFDKPLKMGGMYTLPSLTVINTGDEASDYEVSVEYSNEQTTMSPPKEWFVFTPKTFHLDPGQSQVVRVQANIPLKVKPGNYFAFLSGHPIMQSNTAGGATIGIAAAAKMYFTVSPSNIFQGIYYRTISIIKNNTPWSYIILVIIGMAVLVVLFRRYFSFNIGIRPKKPKSESESESETETKK